MNIPLLDLKRQYQTIRDEVMKVTEEVYESQIFILGKKVSDFEENFARYCQTPHAVGVSSGTDALLEALMVAEVGHGDEVIVPAYSFFATAGVVARLGAVPVFVDIDRDSFNIDPTLIEERITSATKAIMPVHLYGQVAEMGEIDEIASKHGIEIIEDAAQAVGAELDGKRAGSFSRYGCFSFFPSKNLGGFGDGGAITTGEREIYEKLLDFRVHGMRPKYYHHSVGGNFRIDALQAAILDVKLARLDEWTEARQRNAAMYEERFAEAADEGRIALPKVIGNRRHVYNQYVVTFPGGEAVRDQVKQTLLSSGIGCEIYYPLTLPQQECFADLEDSRRSFPVSEAAAKSSLALPIFSELEVAEIDRVAEVINAALDEG